MNKWKKFEELHIFRAGINTLVDINTFQPLYYEAGIDFFSTGKDSVFTKANFESAIASSSAKKERKLSKKNTTTVKKGFFSRIFSYF